MGLYYYDSFQNYTGVTGATPWDAASWCSIEAGANRVTGQALRKDGFNQPQIVTKRFLQPGTTTQINHTDSTLGIACNFLNGTAGTGTWDQMLTFYDSSFSSPNWTDNVQLQVQMGNNGQVRVMRGAVGSGTVLGTSTGTPFTNPGWHYVEFYALINSTAGAVTVKVDGVAVITLTNVNTQNTSNAQINGFALGGNSSTVVRMCDLYILDSTGTVNNTFLGDVHVLYCVPAANGLSINFTPNAIAVARSTAYTVGQFVLDPNGNTQKCTTAGTTATSAPSYSTSGTTTDGTAVFTFAWLGSANFHFVNELAPPDDLSTYVYDSNVNDTELYQMAPLANVPVGVGQAFAVGVDFRAEKDQTFTRSLRAYCSSGGTTADSGIDVPLANGTFYYSKQVFQVDPHTGAAWTISAVNSANFGVKITA